MKPDPRLITFAWLTKASNCMTESVNECSLVRAYRKFEKDCIFSPDKGDSKISQKEGRRVRWIMVYSVLQTLLSVTNIPSEVRDTHNVSYNLCVQTAGCPPWKQELPYSTLLRTQTDQTKLDFVTSLVKSASPPTIPSMIKPDVDYLALNQRSKSAQQSRRHTIPTALKPGSRRGTIRRALSTLGNMPELAQPIPTRPLFHEILVHGYGNGLNAVISDPPTISPLTLIPKPLETNTETKKSHLQRESIDSSTGDVSSRWSNYSIVSSSRDSNSDSSASSHESWGVEGLKLPIEPIVRPISSVYSRSSAGELVVVVPLRLRENHEEIIIDGGERTLVWDNDELVSYLRS